MNIPEKAIEAAREHLPHPNLMRALEAAAPFIAAQAWTEGYAEGDVDAYYGHPNGRATNPYRIESEAPNA